MADQMSQTQKVLDEKLKERIKKATGALCESLDDKNTCGKSHCAVVEGELVLLELDQLNHAGIQDTNSKISTLTKAIEDNSTHEHIVSKGPLRGIPVRYVFAGSIILAGFATVIILYALGHGKMSELAEGINALRGRRSAAVATTPENVAKTP